MNVLDQQKRCSTTGKISDDREKVLDERDFSSIALNSSKKSGMNGMW